MLLAVLSVWGVLLLTMALPMPPTSVLQSAPREMAVKRRPTNMPSVQIAVSTRFSFPLPPLPLPQLAAADLDLGLGLVMVVLLHLIEEILETLHPVAANPVAPAPLLVPPEHPMPVRQSRLVALFSFS